MNASTCWCEARSDAKGETWADRALNTRRELINHGSILGPLGYSPICLGCGFFLLGCLGNLDRRYEFCDGSLHGPIHFGDNARYAVLFNFFDLVNGIGPDRIAGL